MIILSLIRALVEENTVNISGFGTFVVKNISSQIKDEVIFPPQNIIVFEYSKEIEGFDFVSKLSQWEQIRIDEAQEQVSKWIDLIEKGLEHNKTIFFEDFGTFSKVPSGTIVFQSVINSKLNVDYEGLEPVVLPSIKKKDEKIILETPVKDKRVVLTYRKRKRDKFWFLFTLSAASVLLLVLFFKESFNLNNKAFFETNEVLFSNSDSFISQIAAIENGEEIANQNDEIEVDNGNSIPIYSKEEKKKSTSIVQTLPESSEIYLPFHEGKYYVIAGSFAKESDALRHIKDKKLEKYQAKLVVQQPNSRVRVCIGLFDNEIDAIEFAEQIDKNYWVLK